jgi:hypothetical protein
MSTTVAFTNRSSSLPQASSINGVGVAAVRKAPLQPSEATAISASGERRIFSRTSCQVSTQSREVSLVCLLTGDVEDHSSPAKKERKRGRIRNALRRKAGTKTEDEALANNPRGATHRSKSAEASSDHREHYRKAEYSLDSAVALTNTPDLSQKRDFILSDQAADDEVQHLFVSLRSSIKSWARAFEHTPPEPISDPSKDQAARLRNVICRQIGTGDLPSLIAHASIRRQLAKGWVYQIFHERILGIQDRSLDGPKTRSQDIWMGPKVAEAVMAIESELLEEVYGEAHEHKTSAPEAMAHRLTGRQFHSWRSYTTSMIARSCLAHEVPASDWYQAQIKETKEQIWVLVSAWLPGSAKEDALNGLDTLVSSAVDFSRRIRQQRAYWTVAWPERSPTSFMANSADTKSSSQPMSPLLFDPKTMWDSSYQRDEEEELNDNCQRSLENHTVELMISPALFKRGDASGNKYDEETCIVHAEVRCKLPSSG